MDLDLRKSAEPWACTGLEVEAIAHHQAVVEGEGRFEQKIKPLRW